MSLGEIGEKGGQEGNSRLNIKRNSLSCQCLYKNLHVSLLSLLFLTCFWLLEV